MKRYPIQILLTGLFILTFPLHGQVQSFTNANLPATPTTPSSAKPSTNNTIPGLDVNTNAPVIKKYPALTADQEKQLQSQMASQIQNAEQRVQSLINSVQDKTRAPMSIDKVELEQAIIDLEVKKTLVGKFQNSPSLRSPNVQQALMSVLSKNGITAGDLANLQSITDSERPYTYP